MEILQEREKTARLNGDKEQSTAVLKEMVDITKTPQETVEVIRQMVRKKGQIKDALTSMIQYAYDKYLSLSPIEIVPHSYKEVEIIDITHAYISEQISSEGSAGKKRVKNNSHESRSKNDGSFLDFLIQLLNNVIEGRIYMEALRIFVTDAIKQIYMAEGDASTALSYIYPVHVETFSSVSMEEIIMYQLEQLRVSILANDYEKALTVSQRMSMKQLEGHAELVDYHLNRMLFIHIHNEEYHKIAEIFNKLRIKDEKNSKTESIYPTLAILFCILDIHNKESQRTLVKNINSKLCYNESRVLGECFTNNLLITDTVYDLIENIQEKYSIQNIIGHYASTIKERVVQYNIIVVSKYYSRIEMSKIVEILKIEKDLFSEVIVEMIRKQMVFGKIGQIEGVIEFKKESRNIEEWNESINSFLEAVIKINHGMSNV